MSQRQSADDFGRDSGLISSADALAILVNFENHLTQYEQQINELNVYPVPDCDTGSNVLATVRAGLFGLGLRPDQFSSPESAALAAEKLNLSKSVQAFSLGELFGEFAQNAALSARGNSGAILSEYFRGLSVSLSDSLTVAEPNSSTGEADINAWYLALGSGASFAKAAVLNPVVGTAITVADKIAEVQPCAQLFAYLGDVSHTARAALAQTQNQLAQLAQAGVVDAGAFALVLFHETVFNYYTKQEIDLSSFAATNFTRGNLQYAGPKFELTFLLTLEPDGNEVETEFQSALKQLLSSAGESLTIVGAAPKFKVHIHTDDIESVITAVEQVGQVSQISTSELSEFVG
ncbi:MAG: DAK2 domain-containing protein [Actinomycetales bacterium]|nr:DAK2 domain-containing protein [Actinomycetales bacterium]